MKKAKKNVIQDIVDAMNSGVGTTGGTVSTSNLLVVTPCLGCRGDKVQLRTDNGLTVLCPVCNGSGIQPAPAPQQSVPYWQPGTTQPNTWPGSWPYESPYRTGDDPWRKNIPDKFID